MLVVFPLGLLGTSVVWDICALVGDRTQWAMISFWTIVAGLVGALLAAATGLVDWLAISSGTRAKRIGLCHMVINLIVVGLFAVSLAARWTTAGGYQGARLPEMIWGWLGLGLALIAAWLGGEMVETLGVSVHAGANENAPSSIGRRRSVTAHP